MIDLWVVKEHGSICVSQTANKRHQQCWSVQIVLSIEFTLSEFPQHWGRGMGHSSLTAEDPLKKVVDGAKWNRGCMGGEELGPVSKVPPKFCGRTIDFPTELCTVQSSTWRFNSDIIGHTGHLPSPYPGVSFSYSMGGGSVWICTAKWQVLVHMEPFQILGPGMGLGLGHHLCHWTCFLPGSDPPLPTLFHSTCSALLPLLSFFPLTYLLLNGESWWHNMGGIDKVLTFWPVSSAAVD